MNDYIEKDIVTQATTNLGGIIAQQAVMMASSDLKIAKLEAENAKLKKEKKDGNQSND